MLPVKSIQQVPNYTRMDIDQDIAPAADPEQQILSPAERAIARKEILVGLSDKIGRSPVLDEVKAAASGLLLTLLGELIAEEQGVEASLEDDPDNPGRKMPKFAATDDQFSDMSKAMESEAPFGLSLRMSLKGKSREELVKMNEGAKLAGDKMVRLSTEAEIRERDEHAQADKDIREMFQRMKQPA